MNNDTLTMLARRAYDLRRLSCEATTAARSGHPTSCLSAADIVAALFFDAMHNDDHFILSKGHAAPVLYAALYLQGIITHDELMRMRTFGSALGGHPTPEVLGVDVATGSLGMGLSMGLGMALRMRMSHDTGVVYVLLGDGELAEGNVWEAAELAAHYNVDHLIAIVDVNRWGQRGPTLDAYDLEKIGVKWRAFGWCVHQVDGHEIVQLQHVFEQARVQHGVQPHVILARTIKGYGVSSIQDRNGFHGKALSPDELSAALEELKKRFWSPSWPEQENEVLRWVAKSKIQPFEPCTIAEPDYQLGAMVSARDACGHALVKLGNVCPALVCLDGDVSNSTRTQSFAEQYPDRFVECFIAEQNMVAMAVGMAARGAVPVAATFGAFWTRAFDQLRMAAISRAPVRAIGSHAGVSVGADGPSQMALEDIAMMCTLPDSTVLCPCDAVSAYKLTALAVNYQAGISYVRTLRDATPVIYANTTSFKLGGFNVLRKSDQDRVVIIAAGVTVHEALVAYEQLRANGVSVVVVDLYCIKPINVQELQRVVACAQNRVVTVEDHYLAGGLGGAVALALSDSGVRHICLAVRELPSSGTGSQLRAWAGIDANAIVTAVQNLIAVKETA